MLEIKEKLLKMLSLQKQLNDNTNGIGWESGVNKYNKNISWQLCIIMEMAELITSLPWKHWKNISDDADYKNIFVELVDIWHFIMSKLLELKASSSNSDIENVILDILIKNFNNIKVDGVVPNHKIMIKKSIALIHEASFDEEFFTEEKKLEVIDNLLEIFAELCSMVGLSFDKLVSFYNGKNCLNQFRQDNGYKEGTYIKIWLGREDNEYMYELVETAKDSISFEMFYTNFETIYKKAVEAIG